MRKQWIIGLHHGITEPKALERVRALPNSTLRVFAGAPRLTLSSMFAGQLFHAKLILVTSHVSPASQPPFLMASSANLTGAAVGTSACNYEAGVAVINGEVAEPDWFPRPMTC
jgi:hypothetical protein